jgi:hypothetical protein
MFPRVFALFLLIAVVGCGRSHGVTGITPVPVTPNALSGQTYNVLSKNEDESVILLGHLRFDPIQDTDVTGTWDLQQWSGPAAVPGLPANGAFTGSLEGSTLILKLTLPEPENSLGIVSRGFVMGRLSGRMSLLPSLGFDGTFEAIRSD